MGSPEHKKKIWNYISEIGTAMMVSSEGEDLRARPMQLVQDSYDGTIWFFNKLESGKTEEVIEDKNVCLTFCNHDKGIHVSLSGRARINKDQELINKFWNEDIATWFPEGKEDKSCSLLEIKIHSGEHWDVETNDLVKIYQKVRANIKNRKPNLGENEKFGQATAH